MTSPFELMRFSQTDTDTEIYFTFYEHRHPIFLGPTSRLYYFYLGRLHPTQAHSTFTSLLGPNLFTSPQVFCFDWAKVTQARMAHFVSFLLCVACHTNTRTKSLMHFKFHTCLFPCFSSLDTQHTL